MVASQRNRLAHAQCAEHRLRHEKARLDIFRRQQREHRAAGRHQLAFAIQHIAHFSRGRHAQCFLVQLPVGLRQLRLRGLDILFGRRNFIGARGELRHPQLRLQFVDMGLIALARGARLVQARCGNEFVGYQFLLARQVGSRQAQSRFGLRQLGPHRGHFVAAFAFLQVGQLRLRPFDPGRRFFARRAFAFLLQDEGRRIARHLVAAFDMQLAQGARDRAGQAHILCFGIARKVIRRLAAAVA